MPRNVKIFDLREWDSLVSTTYKKLYSFQQQDGCKERRIFYFTIPLNKEDLEDYEDHDPSEVDEKDILGVSFKSWLKYNISNNPSLLENLLWTRNFYPHISMIINDLYKRGILEKGDYGIDIDW